MSSAEQAERREQIERRLQKLREERNREQALGESSSSSSLSPAATALLVSADPEVLRVGSAVVRVGDHVRVRDDQTSLDRADAVLPRQDRTKLVYLGERGVVCCILHEFYGKPGVEIKFADDAVKFFFAECLDVGAQSTKPAVAVSALAGELSPAQTHADPNSGVPATLPPPSWSQLRNPKDPKQLPVAASKSPEPQKAPADVVVATTLPAAATAVVAGKHQQGSAVDGSQPAAAPLAVSRSPDMVEGLHLKGEMAAGLLARPRVTGYLALKALDDDDNLLKTPRNESWSKPTSLLAAASSSSSNGAEHVTVRPAANPSRTASIIPTTCSPSYVGKYPYPDPLSSIHVLKKQQERVAVKRCTLIDKDTLLAPHKDSDFRGVALRENLHESWDSILSACTKELGWTGQSRRVTRLFTLSGQEILWPDAIREGMCLVATAGETYAVPAKTNPGRMAVAPINLHSKRSVSPVGLLSKVPAALPVGPRRVSPCRMVLPPAPAGAASAKPMTLRVFVNGEYGDVVSERTPFRSVTIRPTHRTLGAVMTTITRELQWHTLGRKCEVLYSACGGELTSLADLKDGDSIVASTGDRFVVPRSNTVLHADVLRAAATPTVPVAASASGSGARARSPVGSSSSSALRAASGAAKPSPAMVRAKQLGVEIQRIDAKASRFR